MEHGHKVECYVKDRAGREAAIRSLQAAGLEVSVINDVTPFHNGRPPKKKGIRRSQAWEDIQIRFAGGAVVK